MGNLLCCYREGDKKLKGTSVKTLLRRTEKPSRRRKRIDDLVTDVLKQDEREERYRRRKNLKAKSEGSSKDTSSNTTTQNLENLLDNDLSRSSGTEKKNQESDPALEYQKQEIVSVNADHTNIVCTDSHIENGGGTSTPKEKRRAVRDSSPHVFLPHKCTIDEVQSHSTSDSKNGTDNLISKEKAEFLGNSNSSEKENPTTNEPESVLIEQSISESRDGRLAVEGDVTGQKDVYENVKSIPTESTASSDNTNGVLIVDETDNEIHHTDDRDIKPDTDHKTDKDIFGEKHDSKDGCNDSGSLHLVIDDDHDHEDDGNDNFCNDHDIVKETDKEIDTFEDDKPTQITGFDLCILKNDPKMDEDQIEITDDGLDKQSYNFATDSDRKMKEQNRACESDTELHDFTINRCEEIEKEKSVFECDIFEPTKDIVDKSAEDVSIQGRQIHTDTEVCIVWKSTPEVTIANYQDENRMEDEHADSNLSDGRLAKNKVTTGIGGTESRDTSTLVPVEVIPKVYSSAFKTNYEDLPGLGKGKENIEAKSKSAAELVPVSKAMPIRQRTGIVPQAVKDIKPSQPMPLTPGQHQFPGHSFQPKSSKLFSKTKVKVLKNAKHPVQTKGNTKNGWLGAGVIDCIMKSGQKPQVKEIERLKKDALNQADRMREYTEQDRQGSIEDLKRSRHMCAEIHLEALLEEAQSMNKNSSMGYTGNDVIPQVTCPLRCQSPTPGCSSTSSYVKQAKIQTLRNRYGLSKNPFSNRKLTLRSPECGPKLSKFRKFFKSEINHSADTSKDSNKKGALHSVIKQLVKSYTKAERRKVSRLGTTPRDDAPTFGIRRYTSLTDLSDISNDRNS